MEGQEQYQPYSDEEIRSLKTGLSNFFQDLNSGRVSVDYFLDDPFEILIDYGIVLLNRLKGISAAVKRFNNAVKDVFDRFRNNINRCLSCKIAVLILIFSLVGPAAKVVDITIDALRTVLEGVEKWVGETGSRIDEIVSALDDSLSELSTSGLAFRICELHGYCP